LRGVNIPQISDRGRSFSTDDFLSATGLAIESTVDDYDQSSDEFLSTISAYPMKALFSSYYQAWGTPKFLAAG
jgi:hypothetical protein